VERHWREWNPLLVPFFVRFQSLESEGVLNPKIPLDLFCLHSTFLPTIQKVLDRHYSSLRMQKKRKSTKNPTYPTGTHRRDHIYAMGPSFSRRITATQAEALRAIGVNHFVQNKPSSLAPRPWEIDPVQTQEGREKRARFMSRHAASTLEEKYRLYRWCTLHLSSRGR
jgi:hypothetical protein